MDKETSYFNLKKSCWLAQMMAQIMAQWCHLCGRKLWENPCGQV